MNPVVSTIALNVLSNFITDALKWAKGTDIPAITKAITSTELLFPELDGVAKTLRQWLMDSKVAAVLSSYVEGHTGTNDLPIEALVSVLLTKTHFYLPEHSQATAKRIISAFAGGPLKPDFGLSGAIPQLDKVFLLLVRAGVPSIPTRSRRVLQCGLRSAMRCSTSSLPGVRIVLLLLD